MRAQTGSGSGRHGLQSYCERSKDGPDRKLSTGTDRRKFRAHQVPLSGVKENPEHLKLLEAWMRSYRPDELFDDRGRLKPEIRLLRPRELAEWARIRTPTADF